MTRRALLIALPALALLCGAFVLARLVPTERWSWNRELAAPVSAADAEALALGWPDLVPEGFVPAPDPYLTLSAEELDRLFDGSEASRRELDELDRAMRHAPVVERLDGRLVTLSGYVVPLDFDGATRLEAFLLVPWFGACTHTPPPPANQIVMAELAEPVELDDPYAPVLLRGVLRTESVTSPLAETGYRMDVLAVETHEPS